MAMKQTSRLTLRSKLNIGSLLCLLTAAVLWVLSYGYSRMMLTTIFFPFVQGAFFFFGNHLAAKYANRHLPLAVLTGFSFACYLLFHLLLTDPIDQQVYLLVGFRVNAEIGTVTNVFAMLFFLIHIGVMIAQYRLYFRCKRREKQYDLL